LLGEMWFYYVTVTVTDDWDVTQAGSVRLGVRVGPPGQGPGIQPLSLGHLVTVRAGLFGRAFPWLSSWTDPLDHHCAASFTIRNGRLQWLAARFHRVSHRRGDANAPTPAIFCARPTPPSPPSFGPAAYTVTEPSRVCILSACVRPSLETLRETAVRTGWFSIGSAPTKGRDALNQPLQITVLPAGRGGGRRVGGREDEN
jgi:hypothetical protein